MAVRQAMGCVLSSHAWYAHAMYVMIHSVMRSFYRTIININDIVIFHLYWLVLFSRTYIFNTEC